jgi:hypothetical protein
MSAYSSRKRGAQEASTFERSLAVFVGLFVGFLLGYIAMVGSDSLISDDLI